MYGVIVVPAVAINRIRNAGSTLIVGVTKACPTSLQFGCARIAAIG